MRIPHQGIELRASLAPTRYRHVQVVPHDFQPGALGIGPQPVELKIRFLIRRRDPEVERGAVLLGHVCLDRTSENVYLSGQSNSATSVVVNQALSGRLGKPFFGHLASPCHDLHRPYRVSPLSRTSATYIALFSNFMPFPGCILPMAV